MQEERWQKRKESISAVSHMEIRLVDGNKEKNRLLFLLKGVQPSFANTLRRIMISEVPVMAVETVEFTKNTSLLYDEILAHRLGLMPLKTDLKSYTMPASCGCKGEGCAKCQLKMTLSAKGPCIVYASDIESNDPKVVPAFPKMIIGELLKGQELELEATAVLGRGIEHFKWSPCLAWYSQKATVTVNNSSAKFAAFKDRYPGQIFDDKGKIDKNLIIDLQLVDAVDGVCDDIVKVEYSPADFMFHVESWGQLDPKEIVKEAASILSEKSEEFTEKVKALEHG
jgi:DNA-directed RNA polymerase subunit D